MGRGAVEGEAGRLGWGAEEQLAPQGLWELAWAQNRARRHRGTGLKEPGLRKTKSLPLG